VTRIALLCAGGTGGHLFPAQALAAELGARGWDVHLVTDDRVERYVEGFPAKTIHRIPSATFAGRNPFVLAAALLRLARGYMQARDLEKRLRPAVAVGFGGYPTLPPLLAAVHLGIPALVHDANAVMGRANRFLAPRVRRVAMGFPGAAWGSNVVVTGNPVRPAVVQAATDAYPERLADDPFRLLVFGGSQGASFFSEAIPQAAAMLPVEMRELLRVTQQARPEDEARVREAWARLGVIAEVAPFFTDMARRIGEAHLVVSRAGASTVSELAVIGRPSILVPYPHALDHDQAMNAAAMQQAGAAQVVIQRDASPKALAGMIEAAMRDPQGLALRAQYAKKTGKPEAARVLADLVEELAAGAAKERGKST
jgi:UDP-N-acetylglucosamine--N-acetylmuramyl-(pentapeptide) pyrophosphoryl-undecaprenol N-acetylglucosamine transferase